MRPMHWSKYLQPNLPSSKGSRASHSSRLRRCVRKVQRSVRVLTEIGKSSFGSCFSGVVFCLLRMFSLNGRKLRLGRWRWCPGVVVGCQVAGCGAGVLASCSAKRHNPHSCSRQKKRGPASVTGHRAWLCWNKLIFSCCCCCCCCLLLAAAAAAVCAAARRDPAVVQARPLTAHRLTARLQSLRLSDQLRQLGAG